MTTESPKPVSLETVDLAALRKRWSELAGDIGRDLSDDNKTSPAVAKRMNQLADIEAYIAVVEQHRHAQRPLWRRWEFWRKIILGGSIVATLWLLYLAFTHPAASEARLDLLGTSIAFRCDQPVELNLGQRFESISVAGLDHVRFPNADGQFVRNKPGMTVSNDLQNPGRLDSISIPAHALVRVRARRGEIGLSVSLDRNDLKTAASGPAQPVDASAAEAARCAVRWTHADGALLTVEPAADGGSEQDRLRGSGSGETRVGTVEGQSADLPLRFELSITIPADEAEGDDATLLMSGFTGATISDLLCAEDDEPSTRSRPTLIAGRISFPDIEVPEALLEEGSRLKVEGLKGSIVRVEAGPDGARLVWEGSVHDVRAGRDEQRSLLPSSLENLFARRFRMYTAGVLLYAVVFIVALLKGEKASIGEGFRPHSLIDMGHGGGHL